jgi:hypothetical protein
MKRSSVFLTAATLGAAVPLIIVAISSLIARMGIRLSVHSNNLVFLFKVMVWPSSFPLSALTENDRWYSFEYLVLLGLAIAANVALYCALGFLFWLSITKFRPLGYLVMFLIVVYWIIVLRA